MKGSRVDVCRCAVWQFRLTRHRKLTEFGQYAQHSVFLATAYEVNRGLCDHYMLVSWLVTLLISDPSSPTVLHRSFSYFNWSVPKSISIQGVLFISIWLIYQRYKQKYAYISDENKLLHVSDNSELSALSWVQQESPFMLRHLCWLTYTTYLPRSTLYRHQLVLKKYGMIYVYSLTKNEYNLLSLRLYNASDI